jgi:hypothetical protein
MRPFKHASEQSPKSYDRIDAYVGTKHSPGSKPPHGKVPVQRDGVTINTDPSVSPGHKTPSVTTGQSARPASPHS